MKNILVFSLFLTNLAQLVFAQGLEYVDHLVAVVNDDVITLYDVSSISAEFEKKVYEQYGSVDSQNLELREQIAKKINGESHQKQSTN